MRDSFVVVGCGSIGRRHALNLASVSGAALSLVDADPGRSAALARATGGIAYDTLEQALEQEPRAAFICSPTSDHLSSALAAARGGCHLFIEKPIAGRLDGLDELATLIGQHRLVAMTGCNMRFHPGPAAVKGALERGEIGDVLAARLHTGSYLPSWRPAQDYRTSYSASPSEGGAVLDCVHEIDLAQWYLGPATLHAAMAQPAVSLGLQTDGLAELLLRHEQGRVSSVHLNFVQRDYSRSCMVIGTNGTLEWSWRDAEVRRFDAGGTIAARETLRAGWEVNQMYLDELRHFLAAIDGRVTPANQPAEATRTLAIALEARTHRVPAPVGAEA